MWQQITLLNLLKMHISAQMPIFVDKNSVVNIQIQTISKPNIEYHAK